MLNRDQLRDMIIKLVEGCESALDLMEMTGMTSQEAETLWAQYVELYNEEDE